LINAVVSAHSATSARTVCQEENPRAPDAFALMHRIQVPDNPMRGKEMDTPSQVMASFACVNKELAPLIRTQGQENGKGKQTLRYRLKRGTGGRHGG